MGSLAAVSLVLVQEHKLYCMRRLWGQKWLLAHFVYRHEGGCVPPEVRQHLHLCDVAPLWGRLLHEPIQFLYPCEL